MNFAQPPYVVCPNCNTRVPVFDRTSTMTPYYEDIPYHYSPEPDRAARREAIAKQQAECIKFFRGPQRAFPRLTNKTGTTTCFGR